jgi:hypothetical protein
MNPDRFDRIREDLVAIEGFWDQMQTEIEQGAARLAYAHEVIKNIVLDPAVPDRHVEALLTCLRETGGITFGIETGWDAS